MGQSQPRRVFVGAHSGFYSFQWLHLKWLYKYLHTLYFASCPLEPNIYTVWPVKKKFAYPCRKRELEATFYDRTL